MTQHQSSHTKISYPLPSLLPEQEPGTKSQGFLTVPKTGLSLPYTCITGAKPGKAVLITAGVHGSEYPAIETARRLCTQLSPSETTGSILILPVVNGSAFQHQLKAIMAEDGCNLNRMFPGSPTGTTSEKLAHFLLNSLMIPSDFYIDMHGGDLGEDLTPLVFYPTRAEEDVTEASKQAAAASGFPYLIASRSISGAYNSAAAHGTPSILTELGYNGLWSEEQVNEYSAAVMRVLQHLGAVGAESDPVCEDASADVSSPRGFCSSAPRRFYLSKSAGSYTLCSAVQELESAHDGFWYPAFRVGDEVKQGDKVGEIRDVFGGLLSQYTSPCDGVLLYQTISLSVRKDVFLAGIAEVLEHVKKRNT